MGAPSGSLGSREARRPSVRPSALLSSSKQIAIISTIKSLAHNFPLDGECNFLRNQVVSYFIRPIYPVALKL